MRTSGHFSVLDFAWKKEVFLAAEHRDVWQCHQCSHGGRMGGWASQETVADSFRSLWRDQIWWVRALAVQTFGILALHWTWMRNFVLKFLTCINAVLCPRCPEEPNIFVCSQSVSATADWRASMTLFHDMRKSRGFEDYLGGWRLNWWHRSTRRLVFTNLCLRPRL